MLGSIHEFDPIAHQFMREILPEVDIKNALAAVTEPDGLLSVSLNTIVEIDPVTGEVRNSFPSPFFTMQGLAVVDNEIFVYDRYPSSYLTTIQVLDRQGRPLRTIEAPYSTHRQPTTRVSPAANTPCPNSPTAPNC